ncbi:ubiquitinyl hydrolase 1 [Ranunculus cassubicifolius]
MLLHDQRVRLQELMNDEEFQRELNGECENRVNHCSSSKGRRIKISLTKNFLLRKKLRLHSDGKMNTVQKHPFKGHYRWTTPPEGYYKLNVSGSKSGGYGAILRDGDGYTVAAVAGVSEPVSALYHQLQGVEAGLLVTMKTIKHLSGMIMVEVPSAYVASVASGTGTLYKEDRNHHYPLVCDILKRIQKLMLEMEDAVIDSCPKETNNAAVYLSKLHCLSEFRKTIEYDAQNLPDVLKAVVEEEAKSRF